MCFKELFAESDALSRRGFMGQAARGLLGVGLMPLFSRMSAALPQDGGDPSPGAATARNVIYLYLEGGMSHIDTFDTKPGSATQGPVETISTSADGVRVSQYFPKLARWMHEVAVINSMQSTKGAHPTGRYLLHTSYDMRGTIAHPSLGAWVSRLAGKDNPTLPPHVAIGAGQYTAQAGWMESVHGPLPIDDPSDGLANGRLPERISEDAFRRRLERLDRMNGAFEARYDQKQVRAYGDMYQQALKLMKSKDLAAFDIQKEPESLRAAYGEGRFGQGCLLARRLVENKVRFVEVVSDGWDTHNDNWDRLTEKGAELDQALSALLADLDVRGLLEETLVVVATEFGRTPRIDAGRNGRDHFPGAFSCLLAGGGVRGGIRHGRTDAEGAKVIESPVTIPDFNATIARALGLPLDLELMSPSGRPFRVADKGRPVLEVLA